MTSSKLNALKQGESGTILCIRGDAAEKQRLASMGINIGFELKILEEPHTAQGPMLINVNGTRLVLAHELTKTICVRLS